MLLELHRIFYTHKKQQDVTTLKERKKVYFQITIKKSNQNYFWTRFLVSIGAFYSLENFLLKTEQQNVLSGQKLIIESNAADILNPSTEKLIFMKTCSRAEASVFDVCRTLDFLCRNPCPGNFAEQYEIEDGESRVYTLDISKALLLSLNRNWLNSFFTSYKWVTISIVF